MLFAYWKISIQQIEVVILPSRYPTSTIKGVMMSKIRVEKYLANKQWKTISKWEIRVWIKFFHLKNFILNEKHWKICFFSTLRLFEGTTVCFFNKFHSIQVWSVNQQLGIAFSPFFFHKENRRIWTCVCEGTSHKKC